MFTGGFSAWIIDSFDFFTVSMTVTELSKSFNESYSDVSWVGGYVVVQDNGQQLTYMQGMTITLMLRSVGAIIFGILSDRYGRKWPMIINLVLFIILELGSGFCDTLPQFLGARALYGIAMGGMANRNQD